ncbi:hypothetical protein FRC07_002928 [Ceratobasidium sp. 392]|nr:hypothetical protein FRC07_002928 [Ceratobasidium sp. 392]
MSFQQAVGGKRRYRRRIHGASSPSPFDAARSSASVEIALEPDESAYEISIVVHVDGVATHKLGTKQKGEPLRWTELCLPCDVTDTSSLTLQIAEVHPFRPRDRVGRAECRMSQIADQNAASIGITVGCDNGMFQVQVRFVDEDTAKRAYTEALSKVQRMESQPGLLGRTGRAGHAFKALLGFGSIMAKRLPLRTRLARSNGERESGVLGLYEGMGGTYQANHAHLEQQERQDAELNELANSLSQMIPSVDSVKDLAGENLRETATDMLNLIEDASLFILSCRPRGSLRRAWIRVVSSDVQEEAQAYIVRFEQLSKEFDRRVNVQVLVVQELERTNATLRELKPVNLAGYDPSRRCVAGTRIYVIDRLAGWARRSDPGPGLAWLHGPAGFGKSSIATSVCLDLNEERALASSFFCKRDSPELRDPRRVLATIAYGLALRYDPYKVAAVAAIREDPELHSRHLQPLYDALLGKPLQTLARRSWPSSILVILVDALDECGDTTTRRQLLVALRSLSRLVPWLKVVLTSRPDADIQEFFAGTDPGWFTEYDVLQYDASADIRIFVRYQTRSVTIFQDETNDAVDQISRQANGLFIWAHTACKDGRHRLAVRHRAQG